MNGIDLFWLGFGAGFFTLVLIQSILWNGREYTIQLKNVKRPFRCVVGL